MFVNYVQICFIILLGILHISVQTEIHIHQTYQPTSGVDPSNGNNYENLHQTYNFQKVKQKFYPNYPNPVTLPTLFQQRTSINPNLLNGNDHFNPYRPFKPISPLQTEENWDDLNCPDKATGQFPYALDCKQYLTCRQGRGFIQNCEPGTVFNPKTQECDFPGQVKCVAYNLQADVFDLVQEEHNNHEGQSNVRNGTPNQWHGESNNEQHQPFWNQYQNENFHYQQPQKPQIQWRPMIPQPHHHYHHQHSPGFYHHHQYNRSFIWPPYQLESTPQGSMCLPTTFECAPAICLALQYVCDGFPHCPNGADEVNCTRYVINFIEHKDQRMMGHDVQKWTTDLDTCAKYCMSSKNFICKSFSYRKSDKLCILNDKVAGETGDVRTFNDFAYYEAKKHSMDCKDQYKCDNLKCINLLDVCNSIDNCGDNSDEINCTSVNLNFAVRLVGSKNVNEGRLEVRAFGRWGCVCDDKFNIQDANVACKELGFPLGAVQVRHSPYYYTETNNVQESKNTTLILMDEVECLGNETSLKDCQFNGWGVHDCKPEEVVGLVCKTKSVSCPDGYWLCQKSMECIPLAFLCDHVNDCDDSSDEMPNICEAKLEFRLVNGSTLLEGRVEVLHFGVWGTICDDDFDNQAAKVICRHMGYNGPARALKGGMFGPGTGPIWLDQLNCVGNESSVDKCLHNEWGKNNCKHSEDAAVICSRGSESPLKKAPGTYGVPTPRRIDKRLTLVDVLPKVCGVRDESTFSPSKEIAFRIVAGSVAEKGHYPWQASLRVRGQTQMIHWCGGVIITPIHVLTAAHCLLGFSKSSYVIRAGDYESEVDEGTEEDAYIEEFYVHEQFRKGHHMNNNIALIKLKGRGFSLGKHIQAICLPHQQTQYTHGKNCTISGWGSIASGKLSAALQLRAGWIPIQSSDICKQPQVYGKAIQDGMFCAGNLDDGVDACDGDLGGPLVCLDNGLFTLYGLMSWGQHCGYANKPGVYVKVGYYRDWIEDTIKKSLK